MDCRRRPPLGLCRRVSLFLVGLTECCIFGGLVFGWPQLVLLLKQEGVYASLCSTNSDHFNESSREQLIHESTNSINATVGESHELLDNRTMIVDDDFSEIKDLTPEKQWELWKTERCGNVPVFAINVSSSDNENSCLPVSGAPCPAQDERLALFFTTAVVCYSLPSVMVGYLLHHAGLWVTRILGCMMLIASFICLGLVSPHRPHFLLPSLVLLAVGGNQLRLCAVQLGDLFPHRRATAITLLMGSYSVSSSVFYVFQKWVEAGLQRATLCWMMAGVASMSLLSTLLMPVKHISQHSVDSNSCMKPEPSRSSLKESVSVIPSLCSMSSILHLYWLTASLFSLNSYQQNFNYWITFSSCTSSEVRTYTGFFSFCGIIGAVVAPVLGCITDNITTRDKKNDESSFDRSVTEVTANFLPLLITSLCSIGMYACLLSFESVSIYASLLCLIICRSCIFSTSTAFLRARFPVEHLDRLLGIYGTITSVLLLLQYPHFVWVTKQYFIAITVVLVLISLNVTYPLHLLHRRSIRNALLQLPQPPSLVSTELLPHQPPRGLISHSVVTNMVTVTA